MVLCLGEPLRRFLFCCCIFICQCFSFCCCSFHCFSTSSLTLPWTIARFLHPFCTFSPAHRRVIRGTFIFYHSVIFLPQALRFWVDNFLPTGVFYLMLLPDIFGTTCFYQGFSGSRQLFLEICRPSPSVCLIHSNPKSFIHLKFVFVHVSIVKVFTCGENFDKKYRSATTLFSSHKNIKQQPN